MYKKTLQDRGKMFKKIRSFFYKKNVLEVDTPSISKFPSIDAHIDIMETIVLNEEKGYLQTSPEYAMKRLLSKKIGDIYQMSHVFRKGELGNLHNPEFMLVEWYRKNISYENFIKEVIEFIFLFLKKLPYKKATYKETFFKYTKLDYTKTKKEKLYNLLKENTDIDISNYDKDTILRLIFSYIIEPNLGKDHLFILDQYPASQAALSKIVKINGELVAKRFEIYYKGIELANGFLELKDHKEQRKRFIQANKERKLLNKKTLPLDEEFLKALKIGIGDYIGVAVGFDRLMMLKHNKNAIADILPFSWNNL